MHRIRHGWMLQIQVASCTMCQLEYFSLAQSHTVQKGDWLCENPPINLYTYV